MGNDTEDGRIQIHVEGDPGEINETTGRAIIAAVAEHVGQPVDLVTDDGTRVGSHADEPEWAGEEVEMTEREKDLRDDIPHSEERVINLHVKQLAELAAKLDDMLED